MKSKEIIVGAVLLAWASMAVGAPAKTVDIELKGEGYAFEYRYPIIASRYPQLQREIDKLKTTQLEELQSLAKEMQSNDDAMVRGMTMETDTTWATVTDLPAYLSLTKGSWSFSGGAHGYWWRNSLVWDKKAAIEREPIDFFTSAAAFDRVVQTRYCDLLDVERSSRRDGEKVDRSQSDDWMQACPKPSELVVILGSSDGRKFNRMAIYAGPYAVGPYSEADYEIDMPITSQLLAIVKPSYRSAFAVTPKARK